MKKSALLLTALFVNATVFAQQDTIQKLEEVVVYSNKFVERKINLVQKIDVISSRRIALTNAQNTGDLLINTGNVFVQKSQQGFIGCGWHQDEQRHLPFGAFAKCNYR